MLLIAGVSSSALGASTAVIKGTAGADKITGTAAADRIYGLRGNDDLNGRAGADVIEGGSGQDRLRGEQGRDVLNGGQGDDQIYGIYPDEITCGAGFDWAWVAGVPLDAREMILLDLLSAEAQCERVRFTG